MHLRSSGAGAFVCFGCSVAHPPSPLSQADPDPEDAKHAGADYFFCFVPIAPTPTHPLKQTQTPRQPSTQKQTPSSASATCWESGATTSASSWCAGW